MIEGLIKSRGVHASGVFITNTAFTDFGAKMVSPKGIITSQWSLYDSEGLTKYDFLTTEGATKIRLTSDLLIKHGYEKDLGNLKDNYNNILDPIKLNYNTEEIWDTVANNNMPDLFQFSTPVAMSTVSAIKPHSLIELAQTNSLMRLQQQEGMDESPTDTYVRFKNDINKWYEEMDKYEVPKKDQTIVATILENYKGVADSQESIMMLSQLKEISNFSISESHKLRKAIAKKSKKSYLEVQELFYKKCKENNVDENTMKYIWDVQVSRQRG